jgi:lipopolysaccharide/colanic/teichoic acid biosynthesis glycosyltransferase
VDRPVSAARPLSINGLKRALDVLIAVSVFVFVSPLMLALAIAIRLTDGGPALYKQLRVGYGGRPFTVYKFRTMVQGADEMLPNLLARDPRAAEEWVRSQKLREDPRVLGAVGRFLRVTSLDELPQLFNIMRGEMSVVGPRPIVAAEVVKYRSYFRYYKAVRPGVTGLWQVSGRNNVSYAKRVRLDAAYARKWCLALDFWILWRTVPAVIMRRGAY